MPSAALNQLYVPGLSQWASVYTNGEFFADQVSPIIEVDERSGSYSTYSRTISADISREDLGGDRAEANEVDYEIGTGTYATVPRSLKTVVPNTLIAAAKPPNDPLRDGTDLVMNMLMLKREVRVATLLDTSGNYLAANVIAAGNLWSDTTSGTPVTNIQSARILLPPDTGMQKTKLVLLIGIEAALALQKHPQFRGGGAEDGTVTMDKVKAILGVDEILITEAVKRTSNPGVTTVLAKVWDKTKARLLRVPVGKPIGKVGMFSATFRWKPNGMAPVNVRKWDEPRIGDGGSQAVQVNFRDHEVVVQNDMGVLITGVMS